MPTLPRPGVALPYLAAYLVTLGCFVIVWLKHPGLTYLGRDADLSLWLHKAYLDWAEPLDVTAMNPMQGMTSMLLAVNPYVDPASWVLQTGLGDVGKRVVSLAVYFLEVTATTYLLGVTLGFSRRLAFVGSLWLAFLMFPPFNFVYGLHGMLGTWPLYGHTLALSNLLLIAFSGIGRECFCGRIFYGKPASTFPENAPYPDKATFARRLTANWLLATAILLLVLLIVLVTPFHNAAMLVGTLLLAGVLFFASRSREQMLWRAAAGAYVAAACLALNFPTFYAGARAAAARFSPGVIDTFELIPGASDQLCGWGVMCGRMTGLPGALTGSYWLQAAIVLGALAAAVRARPPLARFAAAFAALWIALLSIWISAALGIIRPLPVAPLYFFLMMYPLWAFFSLYAGAALVGAIEARIGLRKPLLTDRRLAAALCVAAIGLLPYYSEPFKRVFVWGRLLRPAATPITDHLRQEIALRPGQIYRGSVATLLAAPDSPMRQRLLGDGQPLKVTDFERFLELVAQSTGNTHDLLDLWWLDIPTLSEYGQGLSKGLAFYMAQVLNAPGEARSTNMAFPRLPKLDVLRAMGVRFVITDLTLTADQAALRRSVPLRGGIDFHLYELPRANIAGFSPRRVSAELRPAELERRLAADPALLDAEAFAGASVADDLVPVERSQLRFERGAVHVTASSTGRSALLLPVQFSHCFRLAGAGSERVTMLRANVIHTLLLFSGELDVRLRWEFSFWRNSGCRGRDAADMSALGLD